MNDDISITARRQAQYTDDVNRSLCSVQHRSRNLLARTPVNPLPYADGNITKSAQTDRS